MKASGYGRFGEFRCLKFLAALFMFYHFVGGSEGLRALTNPKAIISDRWPSLMQTSIPSVLDYPIRSLVRSWLV